ncbi:MAG TPA: response regulator [Patescibacteria group bacterium]|nr:response regulator [Patescibacteria group bacterium]
MKVLLVEDDDFMRDMIGMVLTAEQYQVCGAANGAEALQQLQENGDCAAVVCDMYLPDTDGLTLSAQLKARCPGLLFLLLTGESDETIRQRAATLGIQYMMKDENFAESILTGLQAGWPATVK